MSKNKKKARAARFAARHQQTSLGFDTPGVWDNTVSWSDLVDKYLVDPDGRVHRVKGLGQGYVFLEDGKQVPGWDIDQNWLSLHASKSQAIRASRRHQS